MLYPGWGDLSSVQTKSEPAWGEPASPTSAVDNGTSAWGKPPGGVAGWGDGGHEPSGLYGRTSGPPASAPCKPGTIHIKTAVSQSANTFSARAHVYFGSIHIYI